MTKKFLIHTCPGVGGMFVASLFAKMMNIPINTKISPVGDCHDMGNGIWQSPGNGNIDFAHVFDVVIKISSRLNCILNSCHLS
jgi:hypothetical protein